jgi:hypothetical protein
MVGLLVWGFQHDWFGTCELQSAGKALRNDFADERNVVGCPDDDEADNNGQSGVLEKMHFDSLR